MPQKYHSDFIPDDKNDKSQFTTRLSSDEEKKFQEWVKTNKIPGANESNFGNYDMRGFWKENPNFQHKEGEHFTDKFKQPGHETFSVESKYAKGRSDAGRWEGDTFIPSTKKSNKYHSDFISDNSEEIEETDNEPSTFSRLASGVSDWIKSHPSIDRAIHGPTGNQSEKAKKAENPHYPFRDASHTQLASNYLESPERGIVSYKGKDIGTAFDELRNRNADIYAGHPWKSVAASLATEPSRFLTELANDPFVLASGGPGRLFSKAGGLFGDLKAARARVPQVVDLGNVAPEGQKLLGAGPRFQAEPVEGEIVSDVADTTAGQSLPIRRSREIPYRPTTDVVSGDISPVRTESFPYRTPEPEVPTGQLLRSFSTAYGDTPRAIEARRRFAEKSTPRQAIQDASRLLPEGVRQPKSEDLLINEEGRLPGEMSLSEALFYEPEFKPWRGLRDLSKRILGRDILERNVESGRDPFRGPIDWGPIASGNTDETALTASRPKGSDIFEDIPDLKGQTIMTGERVRDLLGVEPKEAITKGWIIPEEEAGTKGYRLVQNRPDLQKKPTARYRAWQQTGLDDIPDFPLYDVEGGPSHGTTTDVEGLKKLGIDVPETPENPHAQLPTEKEITTPFEPEADQSMGGLYPTKNQAGLNRFLEGVQGQAEGEGAERAGQDLEDIFNKTSPEDYEPQFAKIMKFPNKGNVPERLQAAKFVTEIADDRYNDALAKYNSGRMRKEELDVIKADRDKALVEHSRLVEESKGIKSKINEIPNGEPKNEKPKTEGKLGPYANATTDELISAVKDGKKPSAILENIPDQQLGMIKEKAKLAGVHITENPILPGEPIISKTPEIGEQLSKSLLEKNHETTGKLLGYSDEDIRAFKESQTKSENISKEPEKPKTLWERLKSERGSTQIKKEKSQFSKKLQDELDYRLDLMEDASKEEGIPFKRNDVDIAQAFTDIENADSSDSPWMKEFGKEIRNWQISKGIYKEITPEEMSRTTVTSGKKYDFKLNGKYYTFNKHIVDEEPKSFIERLKDERGSSPVGEDGKPVKSQTPTESAVNKLFKATLNAKESMVEQAQKLKVEKARRFAAFEGVKSEGVEGAKKSMGKLRGEYEKSELPDNLKLSKEEANQLFTAVKRANITTGEKARGYTALFKLMEGGEPPVRSELAVLDHVFGNGFAGKIIELHGGLGGIPIKIGKAANTMKAMMGSIDVSAPMRQGIGLIHKPEWRDAFVEMFKYFHNKEYYEAAMQHLENRPTYLLGREAGLFLNKPGSLLSSEELFLNSYIPKLSKIPVLGRVLKAGVGASERAYSGFLNKLRADVFDSLIKEARVAGHEAFTIAEQETEDGIKKVIVPSKTTENISKFINNATGRGSLGKLEKVAPELNTIIWSPRLVASRLTVLNPTYYYKMDAFTRKEAIKSLFAIAATGAVISSLASVIGGKSLGNPFSSNMNWFSGRKPQVLSSDFGKVRMPSNNVLDPWGGFQQPIVAAARFMAGRNEVGPQQRSVTAENFAVSKLSPIASLAYEIASAKKWTGGGGFQTRFGQPSSVQTEIGKRFVPIFMQDFNDLVKSDASFAEKVGMSGAAAVGMGVQDYPERTGNKPRRMTLRP